MIAIDTANDIYRQYMDCYQAHSTAGQKERVKQYRLTYAKIVGVLTMKEKPPSELIKLNFSMKNNLVTHVTKTDKAWKARIAAAEAAIEREMALEEFIIWQTKEGKT